MRKKHRITRLSRFRPNVGGPKRPAKIQSRISFEKDAYGPYWEALAQECKRLNNYTCKKCKTYFPVGKRAKLHAHHKTPLSKGGKNTLANMQCLCVTCHEKTHGRSFYHPN